ncbi:acetate kinase [Candidatus Woesearchaeota archaeon]|nr:acetate kinase [Candidatus Woesearchaeota archaeon]
MHVLVLNAGSSSLKFELLNADTEKVLVKGHVDGVGLDTCVFTVNGASQRRLVRNHEEAVRLALGVIDSDKIDAVGHRVVHGGEKYKSATKINEAVIRKIRDLSVLAPLHNPHNLAGILACQKALPGIPQVAVFDTAFHQTIPKKAYLYAIPLKYYTKYAVRKYGFHGTSHKYVMLRAKEILRKDKVNIVTCHLGNGSSVCAIKDNKSIDTSMGFTPLQGLMMGTRSGDVDAEIVSFLSKKEGLGSEEVVRIFNKKSGLLGISGFSDVRTNRKLALRGKKNASLALDMFSYRVLEYISSYIGVVGGVDAVVFTAGIGQEAYYIREKIVKNLEFLGVKLDKKKNKKNELVISTEDSKIKVLVIPTNEELMIAKETRQTLKKSRNKK